MFLHLQIVETIVVNSSSASNCWHSSSVIPGWPLAFIAHSLNVRFIAMVGSSLHVIQESLAGVGVWGVMFYISTWEEGEK